ncbi:MAG: aromatic ring-hydroxylating dioxygenase subunit alpha [Gammaproteobacteria bacterium]|nr:aromatic ring-hydroxylating dioxygenase subunit alpha [Gammaproteobacteria bacterium]
MSEAVISRDVARWGIPELRGHTIPGDRYTSKEFAEQEWEHMWTKAWLLLGRESELPNYGDWQMEEVGPESIIMVRQEDGSVKAFYNVCQHRGNPLVDDEKGSVKRFVCRYHSWAFLPDGSLNFAPDRHDFPQGDPCDHIRLEELRCETFAGFVWVNMDPDCVTLKEYLGPIWEDWQRWEIQNWRRYVGLTTELNCNWKVVLDNFNESYHVPTVHLGATIKTNRRKVFSNVNTNVDETLFDMSEEGQNRMIMEGGYAAGQTDKMGNIMEPMASELRFWGLDPADFKGRPEATRIALQKAKREQGPKRGYTHYNNLPDAALTDAFHYTLFPNFAVSVWADGFHFLRARPHPNGDPQQCVFDNWWYCSQPEGEKGPVSTQIGPLPRNHPDEHIKFKYGERSMGKTIDEDMAVFIMQQRGFRSRGFKGVYLAQQENRVRRYHELIDDYIEGRRPLKQKKSKSK